MDNAGEVRVQVRLATDRLASDEKQVRTRLGGVDKNLAKPTKAMHQFANENSKASTRLRELSNNIAILQGPLGPVAGRVSYLATGIERMGVVGVAAGLSLAGLIFTAHKAIRAFTEFQRQQLTTAAVLRSTGDASGKTAGQIEALAEQIGYATLASTRGARDAANILLTFKTISGDAFDRTLKAAQDLAALGLGSITSAALQLGKAIEEPAIGLSMLRREGVSFSEAQKKVIQDMIATGQRGRAMNLILKQIEAQVAGAGVGAAGGLAGAWDSLSEATGFWLERVGGQIAAATGLRDIIQQVADAMRDANKAAEERLTAQGRLEALDKRIAELNLEIANAAGLGARTVQGLQDKLDMLVSKRSLIQWAAQWEELNNKIRDYVAAGKAAAAEADREQGVFEGTAQKLRQEIDLTRRGALAKQIDAAQRKAEVAVIAGEADHRTALQKQRAAEIAQLVTEQYYLKQGLALMQQRIAALGPMATVESVVAAKRRELNEARRDGLRLSKSEQAIILNRTRVQAQEQKLTERGTYGLVTAQEAQRQKQAELNLVTSEYNLTAEQQAGAMAVLEKKYRDIYEASTVAASRFPDLTRAALDATNATRRLGRFGSSAIDSLSGSISDIVSSAKTMGEAFRSAAISIVADFTQMIVKASLYRAALALIPGLGGAAPTGGGLLGGTLIPGILHAGGAVDSAPAGPPVAASYFADAPKFAAGLSKRAPGINEVPILAHRGEVVGWPDQMRAAFGGGGAKVINVNLTMDLTGANGDLAIARAAAAAGQAAVQQAAQQLSEYDRRLPARLRDVRVRGA